MNEDSADQVVCGELTPSGYKLEHIARSTGKGGGVAILHRESLNVKKLKSYKCKSFEVLELMLTTRGDSLCLCVIYRPPSRGKHSRPMSVFLQDFQCYMDTHITLPSKLVVLGDFNVHVDRKDNADARKFVDLLFSLNLEQHVHCPTHKHGHTLDLVILRTTDAPPVQLEVHPAVLSDHSPITFKLHTRMPVPTKKHVSYRLVKKIDIDAFKSDIRSSPLHPASGFKTAFDLDYLSRGQVMLCQRFNAHIFD